jgi:S-formylglutathione hydrolase FrmB
MAVGEMEFSSRALHRTVPFSFFLPEGENVGPPPYPALLQLHGAYDTYHSWLHRSKLAVYLERLPFVVIMPNGELSGWSNWRLATEPFEDFILQDLLPACERFFPIRPGRWAIGGLSMGGYGALRLGLKYPDRFASIYAHSSAFWGEGPNKFTEFPPEVSAEDRVDADVYTQADRALGLPNRPVLGFDCGVDDPLIEQNRAFHQHLNELGYPHEYEEHTGGHTWEYWDTHVLSALQQHVAVLGL